MEGKKDSSKALFYQKIYGEDANGNIVFATPTKQPTEIERLKAEIAAHSQEIDRLLDEMKKLVNALLSAHSK